MRWTHPNTHSVLYFAFDEVDEECINHRYVETHPQTGEKSILTDVLSEVVLIDGMPMSDAFGLISSKLPHD